MNQRISTIVVVALIVSGLATYAAYRLIVSRSTSSAQVTATPVVQAARPIEIGAVIKDADLKMGAWVGSVPAGMAVKKESLIGRGVMMAIYEGEPVMESRLAPIGMGGGLAVTIPPGMRACAVAVNQIVGVAGFVLPGVHVDVLISGTVGPGGAQVKTLLQNIEVLSAGQNYQKDIEGKPNVVAVVNLLVTPQQAEVLSLASNEARIQLVLRNPMDKEPAKTTGSGMASLFDMPKPPPAPRPQRPVVPAVAKEVAPVALKTISLPPYQIEVFNGPQRTEAKFVRPVGEKQ
jgi:pilus assembly protein CpaB